MKNLSKFYTVVLFLGSFFVAFADPGTTDTTDTLEGVDAPPAPINNYILILALAGLFIVFIKLKNYYKQEKSNL
jgi:hypothetical protein